MAPTPLRSHRGSPSCVHEGRERPRRIHRPPHVRRQDRAVLWRVWRAAIAGQNVQVLTHALDTREATADSGCGATTAHRADLHSAMSATTRTKGGDSQEVGIGRPSAVTVIGDVRDDVQDSRSRALRELHLLLSSRPVQRPTRRRSLDGRLQRRGRSARWRRPSCRCSRRAPFACTAGRPAP